MLGRVGVSRADVFVLQGFELLLRAEFVGLDKRALLLVNECDSSRVCIYHLLRGCWDVLRVDLV